MNKTDLIVSVAHERGCSVIAAKAIVEEMFSSMTDALVAGGRVEIRGFGSLAVKTTESYVGKNPKSRVAVVVAAKKVPYFKIGREMSKRINR